MDLNTSESFFQRWARRKAENSLVEDAARSIPPQAANSLDDSALPSLPTLADVSLLTSDSNYGQYLTAQLDKSVHRAAMKKLFSDPHFNRMDGLDIYIDDYTKPSPVSAAMLAGLAHAKSTLWPQPAWQADPGPETSTSEPAAVIDGDAVVTMASEAPDAHAVVSDGVTPGEAGDPKSVSTVQPNLKMDEDSAASETCLPGSSHAN